jgi:hypothetical protein
MFVILQRRTLRNFLKKDPRFLLFFCSFVLLFFCSFVLLFFFVLHLFFFPFFLFSSFPLFLFSSFPLFLFSSFPLFFTLSRFWFESVPNLVRMRVMMMKYFTIRSKIQTKASLTSFLFQFDIAFQKKKKN